MMLLPAKPPFVMADPSLSTESLPSSSTGCEIEEKWWFDALISSALYCPAIKLFGTLSDERSSRRLFSLNQSSLFYAIGPI